MLTPAQQKIRQELEELQVKGLLLPKQESPPPRVPKRKSWLPYLFGILLLTIICSFYYMKSTKQQDEMTINYIIKVQAYNAKSNDLLKGFMEGAAAGTDLNQAITEQNELLQNTFKLDVPNAFYKYQQDFIEVMKLRESILTTHVRLNKDISQVLRLKQELAKVSFSNALAKVNIKNRSLEDGTIQFWIHSKSYQY